MPTAQRPAAACTSEAALRQPAAGTVGQMPTGTEPVDRGVHVEPHVDESYAFAGATVERTVTVRSGTAHTTTIRRSTSEGGSAYHAFWQQWLRGEPLLEGPTAKTVRTADLFAGCGGLSVGVRAAAEAIGLRDHTVIAADMNDHALAVFKDNFSPDRTIGDPIESLVDGTLGTPLSRLERDLTSSLPALDLAVGGPPCQGHSDLNNHTRRNDPKNSLYLRMARFVEVVRPRSVIIENVPGVVHDKAQVVAKTSRHLAQLGYSVSAGVIAADAIGWAQARKRHVMLASLAGTPSVAQIQQTFEQLAPPVWWAIGDLQDAYAAAGEAFDTSARPSARNQERMDFLISEGIYDLPDQLRPDCHRLKPHTYRAVYGRLNHGTPAPTITSGFGSTGQGRFVHPFQSRTLTPHEAARIQGFPDSFSFDAARDRRRALQEMIGNAVPSRLAYAAALHLFALDR